MCVFSLLLSHFSPSSLPVCTAIAAAMCTGCVVKTTLRVSVACSTHVHRSASTLAAGNRGSAYVTSFASPTPGSDYLYLAYAVNFPRRCPFPGPTLRSNVILCICQCASHISSPLCDTLHPMCYLSLTGVAKAPPLSPPLHGNTSSYQGGQVPQRLPHLRLRPPPPYRPPTTLPHPQHVITTITHETTETKSIRSGSGSW